VSKRIQFRRQQFGHYHLPLGEFRAILAVKDDTSTPHETIPEELPMDRHPLRRRLSVRPLLVYLARTRDMSVQLRKLLGRWFTAGLLICIPFSASNAQVNRVDGTLATSQTVTITGGGFGTKATARPLYYWNFGVSTATSPISRTTFSGPVAGALSTAVVAPGSNTALREDMAGTTEAFGPGPGDGVPFNSSTLYVWAKKYYGFNLVTDAGSNGMNLKFFRLWYPFTHDTYTGYQGAQGLGSGRTMAEVTSDAATWWLMPHESNRWVIDEWEYRASDMNQTNGAFNYIRDGIAAYARTSTAFPTRNSGHPELYTRLFFDQISNNTLTPGKHLYFDSIYVDDTWQRVVISDEATWQTSVYGSGTKRKREIQIPTSWSDTQIQISVRKGALDNLATSYLYVLNAQGNPISNTGFALSLANNGQPLKTPRPATAVSAQ
jgi:hypothetical protein